jgi:hypothetical protein
MLGTLNATLPNEFEKVVDLQGRNRDGPRKSQFRCYVTLYDVNAIAHPALFPMSLRRSRKVRSIVRAYYPVDTPDIDLREWAEKAVAIFDEILPELDPIRLPTHFLLVGIIINGRFEPFFKTFLSLQDGIRPSDKCARQIGAFVFHWLEGHVELYPEDLTRPQTWILDCLLAQWRLLRKG